MNSDDIIEEVIEYKGNELFENIIDELNINPSSLAESDYAKSFLNWSKNSMFYNVETKKYHIYNGKYFKVDSEALLLKKKLQEFAIELVEYANRENVDSGVMLKLYQIKVQKKVDTIIEALKTFSRIESNEIDQYDNLFNVQNGILNVDTEGLLDHSSEYKITHISDVEYKHELGEVDGEAKEILLSFFHGDEEVLNFMFEFLGKSLHGNAGIRKFIYAFGSGKNGKSTFFNFFVNSFFGNYATSTNFQAFTGTRENTRASSDLVPLFDKRFVVANEAQTNHKLNTNLIKSITGGDSINGRLNFQDERTFQPHCKLVMFGNNQLEIDDSSEGMQDRYIQIPFKAKFDKGNQRSQEEIWNVLEKNKSQILNSLLAGYQRVKKNGFSEVESIKEASLEGFVSSNSFMKFKKENLIDEIDSRIKMKEVFDRYKNFANREELPKKDILSKSAMISYLKSSGCKVIFNRQDYLIDFRLNNEELL